MSLDPYLRLRFVLARYARLALFACIVALAGHSLVHATPVRKASSGTSEVRIVAALVDQEMSVRPVPLHGVIISTSLGDTIRTRTGPDGAISISLPPGTYIVSSISPVVFQGHRYRWVLPFTVTSGRSTQMSLTNDNATVEDAPAPERPSSDERVDASAALFERYARSVFRVEAGLAHGTAFVADTLGGVLITNAHVIENTEANNLFAVLDSRTRARAQLLARDSDADIAVLRIHPSLLEGRNRVPLQRVTGEAPVVPGERLVALGYPLHQDLTITTGIASSLRAGAVISDVNINPGNSGGPLLNIHGEVVAVNTFGEVSERGGPGVSGSVLISRAGPALARAAAEIQRTGPPPPDILPVLPRDALQIASVKAYAESADVDLYEKFSAIDLGPFEVTLQTPARTFVALKVYENDIAKDRKKREVRAGLSESERFSQVREYRDWAEYVGAPTTPVISFAIIPKLGETGGSVFRRMMLSQNLQATYRFRGDVRGAQVFRNGEPVEPIRGGHTSVKVYEVNRWVSLKDIADQGMYIFDLEILRPDSSGAPPTIVLAVRDLKKPKKLRCLEFPNEIVAQAWNEFEEFYRLERPTFGFRRADARAAKKRRSAQAMDFLKGDCAWPDYLN